MATRPEGPPWLALLVVPVVVPVVATAAMAVCPSAMLAQCRRQAE